MKNFWMKIQWKDKVNMKHSRTNFITIVLVLIRLNSNLYASAWLPKDENTYQSFFHFYGRASK